MLHDDLLLDHELNLIPKIMPGRHFKQILIQTKLNRPSIGANSVERDFR